MSNSAAGAALDGRGNASHMPTLSKDLIVYGAIAFLIWVARQITLLDLFKSSDDINYWLGVTGASLMLLMMSYPLRKHLRVFHNWGGLKTWLAAHMVMGIGGPMLILIHSGFRFGSLNAGVALWSMIIVVASGVIGRFIYTRVNRGLYGEKMGLEELKERSGIEKTGVRSRLTFAPEVEKMLVDFSSNAQSGKQGWRAYCERVFVLPCMQWLVYLRCIKLLQIPLKQLAVKRNWDRHQRAEHKRLARKLVRRYLNAVVRVEQFGAYEWMLSAWHIAHIPFVYLLAVTTVIHIFAVHAY